MTNADGSAAFKVLQARFGGVPGRQTVPRAENFAIKEFILMARHRPAVTVSDAKYVVDNFKNEEIDKKGNGDMWLRRRKPMASSRWTS